MPSATENTTPVFNHVLENNYDSLDRQLRRYPLGTSDVFRPCEAGLVPRVRGKAAPSSHTEKMPKNVNVGWGRET